VSRYSLPGKEPGYHVAVGLDRPLQEWFFQLYAPAPVATEEDPYPDNEPMLWKDTRDHLLIVALMDKYCDMTNDLTKKVRDAIGGDLDPDQVLKKDTT